MVLCLGVALHSTVQYSGEVEISLNKILSKEGATRVVCAVFPLKGCSAEVTLHTMCGERAVQSSIWNASPYNVVCTTAVVHPLSLSESIAVSPKGVLKKTLSSAATLPRPPKWGNVGNMNITMGLGGIPSLADDIEAIKKVEELKGPYDSAHSQICGIFEDFLRRSSKGDPITREVLTCTEHPEETLLSILKGKGVGTADVSLVVPHWLEDVAGHIASRYEIARKPEASPAKNQPDAYKARLVRNFKILKTTLHRFFYGRTIVFLRRPPVASGAWLDSLNKARLRDEHIRDRAKILRKERQNDLAKWGVPGVELKPASISLVTASLSMLRGGGLSPYDTALVVTQASLTLTRLAETIMGAAVGADVFFPLFTFCVAEADLPDPAETLVTTENFLLNRPISSHIVTSEMEYYMASFSACLTFLESKNDIVANDFDDNSSQEWSDDVSSSSSDDVDIASPPSSCSSGLRTVDREWRLWLKARKGQNVRDRANEAWYGGVSDSSGFWKHPKLKGRRRGWYWRRGLGERVHHTPSSYECHAALLQEEGVGGAGIGVGVATVDSVSVQSPAPTLLAKLDQTERSKRLVEIDLPRIFPRFGEAVVKQMPALLPDLRRVLQAWVHARPDVGYIQGMGYLALMHLLHSDDPAEAFMGFAATLQCPILASFYAFESAEMELQFQVFDRLLQLVCPNLFQHFLTLKVATRTFLFDWWMTLWTQFDSDNVTAPLWCLYFSRGAAPNVLHGISAGILVGLSPMLLQCSDEEVLCRLSQIKTVTIDADQVLTAVTRTVQMVTETRYTNTIAYVKRNDPKLVLMPTTATYHAPMHTNFGTSSPQHALFSKRSQRRFAALHTAQFEEPVLQAVEWVSSRPLPEQREEVPNLREWAWEYSKHAMSSKWDMLLKYAERTAYRTVLVGGVDYLEWVTALVTNWAETDEEYVRLLTARQSGIIFTEQVTAAHRDRSPSAPCPQLADILSRIPQVPSRGWSPHSYLAVADGAIQIRESNPTQQIPSKGRAFRVSDAYSLTQGVPLPVLVRSKVEVEVNEGREAVLFISVCVWLKQAAEGPWVTRVGVGMHQDAGGRVGPFASLVTPVHTPARTAVGAQISPTERLEASVPPDTPLSVVFAVETEEGHIIGKTEQIQFFHSPLSKWMPLMEDGSIVGKVRVHLSRKAKMIKPATTTQRFPSKALTLIASFFTLKELSETIVLISKEWTATLDGFEIDGEGVWGGGTAERALRCAEGGFSRRLFWPTTEWLTRELAGGGDHSEALERFVGTLNAVSIDLQQQLLSVAFCDEQRAGVFRSLLWQVGMGNGDRIASAALFRILFAARLTHNEKERLVAVLGEVFGGIFSTLIALQSPTSQIHDDAVRPEDVVVLVYHIIEGGNDEALAFMLCVGLLDVLQCAAHCEDISSKELVYCTMSVLQHGGDEVVLVDLLSAVLPGMKVVGEIEMFLEVVCSAFEKGFLQREGIHAVAVLAEWNLWRALTLHSSIISSSLMCSTITQLAVHHRIQGFSDFLRIVPDTLQLSLALCRIALTTVSERIELRASDLINVVSSFAGHRSVEVVVAAGVMLQREGVDRVCSAVLSECLEGEVREEEAVVVTLLRSIALMVKERSAEGSGGGGGEGYGRLSPSGASSSIAYLKRQYSVAKGEVQMEIKTLLEVFSAEYPQEMCAVLLRG